MTLECYQEWISRTKLRQHEEKRQLSMHSLDSSFPGIKKDEEFENNRNFIVVLLVATSELGVYDINTADY